MNRNLQFVWSNFDKIVLVFLLCVLVSVHVHMIAAVGNVVDPSESSQINWLENIIGQILAALLTLLVTQPKPAKETPKEEPPVLDGQTAGSK